MMKKITVQQLQDAINDRLKKYDGKKVDPGKADINNDYHKWYMEEIRLQLEAFGISSIYPATWRILVDTKDRKAPVVLTRAEVAEVEVTSKLDRRYNPPRSSEINAIRVRFKTEYLAGSVEDMIRAILADEKAKNIDRLARERERLTQELQEVQKAISEIYAFNVWEAEV